LTAERNVASASEQIFWNVKVAVGSSSELPTAQSDHMLSVKRRRKFITVEERKAAEDTFVRCVFSQLCPAISNHDRNSRYNPFSIPVPTK